MLQPNTLYCGDNLEILKTFEDDCVDLCYIDPPFFTNQHYEVIWGDGAEIRAFEDRWIKHGDGKFSKDMNTYLNFMEPRIREIYRVLKPTGSFWIHCDPHADAYLRALCDQIFGYDNLRSQIVWNGGSVSGFKSQKNGFIRQHDNIFYYVKSDNFTFNKQYIPLKNDYIKKMFKKSDENGLYRERKRKDKEGNEKIVKQYLKDSLGMPIGTVWNDIYSIQTITNSPEVLGYPTQKPEALLERIIQASSNENDFVLDAFAGCGTTLAVAKRLNRHFIGIDISPTACRLVAKRIGLEPKNVVDMPLTTEEIAGLTGYEFQNYIIDILEVGVEKRHAKVNKRGADGGFDGWYYDYLLQVKKYKAGRKDLDEFVATLYRNKQTKGIFIAIDYSSDFIKELYRLKREDSLIILPLTLNQIIEREHLKIIPILDTDIK